ncbi:MAG: stage III sporulation protein AF [Lachnospiraceae bacterium]
MADAFFGVIKQIIVFCLCSFVLQELTPKEEYKKYFNLFSGLVLILIIFRPLTDAFLKADGIDDMLKKNMLRMEVSDMDMVFADYDSSRNEQIVSEYKNEIIKKIDEIISDEGLLADSIDVTLNMDAESEDFLKVLYINAKVTNKYRDDSIKIKEIVLARNDNSEDVNIINIKNKLSQFYNIETDNINIIK